MWRGLEPLLVREPAADDRRRKKAGEPDELWLRPEIFEQLAAFSSDGALPRDHVTRIRTIGMEWITELSRDNDHRRCHARGNGRYRR